MAKILLAEDEEGLRLLLRRQLSRTGHTVVECVDGAEALAVLQQQPFDLVLSDMKMPRLDGMGLLNAARERNIDVDFIVLTGHGSLEGAIEVFRTGLVRDYLLKPMDDIRTLNVVVDRALERRHLQTDNNRLVQELQNRVTDLEAARCQLLQMAEEDALTGLLNYRGIHNRLESMQTKNELLTVVLLDADRFKYLNDLYGHPFGDQVLCTIAQTLRAFFGPTAYLGRCGGDEFMIVCPGAEAAAAAQQAQQVQEYLGRASVTTPNGTLIPIAVCFGIADLDGVEGNCARLVAAADVALYQGKERGRGQINVYGTHHISKRANSDTDHPLAELFTRLDRNNQEHSEQMSQYAYRLAQRIGLSDESCDAVLVAGILHDIGKIAVPDEILLKPGALTTAEYAQVKEHVTYSMRIIKSLPLIDQVMSGVAHHHERWDGKGYPNGLQETEIPLLGRVLAIADAFSAMIMSRPYRAGLSVSEALSEVERNAGAQFDPELAALFVEMVYCEENTREVTRLAA